MATSTLLPHKTRPPPSAAAPPSRSRGRAGQTSYLGPFGVDEASLDGVVQGGAVLAQAEVGGRAVAVQDAVLRVGVQGVSVQVDGRLEVAALARLVALLHLLHELRFAETIPDPSVSRNAPDRSARRPRAED